MDKRLNDMSIRKKLIGSYIFLVVLPVISVGLMLIFSMRRISLDYAVREMKSGVENVQRDLEEGFRRFIEISNDIYIDKRLEEVVTRRYANPSEVRDAYLQFTVFDDYLNRYREIKGLRIYSDNETLMDNWRLMRATEEIKATPWYRQAVLLDGQAAWLYAYDETTKEYYLTLVRLVKNIQGRHLGVLVMNMSKAYLHSMVKSQAFDTMVIDEAGFIVAAKEDELIGKNTWEDMDGDWLKGNEGIYSDVYKGRNSKILVKNFIAPGTSSGFRIVSIFPIEEIVGETRKVSILGISIITVSLISTFAIIIVFSRGIARRVDRLSSEMHNIALGNLNVPITVDGKDEIGRLAHDLRTVVKGFKTLIHEVYEVKMQKNELESEQKEIKLKMLANQINPHFLFNALETIRMKAHGAGQREIADKVKLLGRILRMSLEAGNEPISLRKEIELIKSYLELQKFRFGEKLEYEIDSQKTEGNHSILPFTLQPIVENAVIHGLEEKEGPGKVWIKVMELDQFLKISVIDNGVGMPSEKLKEIRDSLNEHEDLSGKGIGLRNVHHRLKLYYGEEYGIEIYSSGDEGTRVELFLPRRDLKGAEGTDYRR